MLTNYERLVGGGRPLLDVLIPGDDQDFVFEPPKARIAARAVELEDDAI